MIYALPAVLFLYTKRIVITNSNSNISCQKYRASNCIAHRAHMPDEMQAIRVHEYGDPSVLRYESVERPGPTVDGLPVRAVVRMQWPRTTI